MKSTETIMKNIMATAWTIARNAHSKFNTKESIQKNGVISVVDFFAESLKLAWKLSKKGKEPKLHHISKAQKIISKLLQEVKEVKISQHDLYALVEKAVSNPYYVPKKKRRYEIQASLF